MTDISLRSKGGGGSSAPPYKGIAPVPAGYFAGKYYAADVDTRFFTQAAITANTIYLLPFTPKVTHTWQSFILPCASSGTGNVRIAIYESDAEYYPADVLIESASFVKASGINDVTINQELTAGETYWLACQSDGGLWISGFTHSTSNSIALHTPVMGVMGFEANHFVSLNNLMGSPFLAHTYGAFPDPISGWDYTTTTTFVPMMLLKA
jgi:hypothetical protein